MSVQPQYNRLLLHQESTTNYSLTLTLRLRTEIIYCAKCLQAVHDICHTSTENHRGAYITRGHSLQVQNVHIHSAGEKRRYGTTFSFYRILLISKGFFPFQEERFPIDLLLVLIMCMFEGKSPNLMCLENVIFFVSKCNIYSCILTNVPLLISLFVLGELQGRTRIKEQLLHSCLALPMLL